MNGQSDNRTVDKPKHPGGRPSKYKPAFCTEIIELMGQGYSLTAAASQIGVHKMTVYQWEKDIPEFSDAIKLARGKRLFKLENDLLGAKDGPTVTSRIFALKNADRDEWTERVTNELTGKDGAPLPALNSVTVRFVAPDGTETGS